MLYNRQLQEQKQAREAEKRLELEQQRQQKQVTDNVLFASVAVLRSFLSVYLISLYVVTNKVHYFCTYKERLRTVISIKNTDN